MEMIKYGSDGIGMNNGLKELKEIGNNIRYSNNEEGIGGYLNEFFNLKMCYY
ncbi:hypothetical protein [Staphylococcus epidermidis]|uniref:hypothetical protein n=1 Tax=Staphylococcus epidermidis TaxID=1282 RepID=UPI0037DA2197